MHQQTDWQAQRNGIVMGDKANCPPFWYVVRIPEKKATVMVLLTALIRHTNPLGSLSRPP